MAFQACTHLSEPHLVSEDHGHAVVVHVRHPRDALHLVLVQLRDERGRLRHQRDALHGEGHLELRRLGLGLCVVGVVVVVVPCGERHLRRRARRGVVCGRLRSH